MEIPKIDEHRVRIDAAVDEVWAELLGRSGTIYRTLIIGTGGHVVLVRRLLATIKTRSEYFAQSSG